MDDDEEIVEENEKGKEIVSPKGKNEFKRLGG